MNWKPNLAGLGALLFAASAVAQTNYTPVFQFGIFYNSLLEFTWCAPMTINGRTHANGSIYTGSLCQLTFNGLVTTTGTISSPAWDGKTTSQYTDPAIYNAGYSTNWPLLTLASGITNLHAIIDMPPNGEDPNSLLGQQRYYNKAELILLVSNSTVSLTMQSSSADPQPTIITAYYYPTNSSPTNRVQVTTNFPFLTLTNTFTDQRESDTIYSADIDMGILGKWLVTNTTATTKFPSAAGVYNSNNVLNILYVADNRTVTNAATQLTAVRLKNGATIPTNMVPMIVVNCGVTGLVNQASGFTVATPNPLYVWGNYNCPNTNYLNTTNTFQICPASLVSDALTILSPAWLDSKSAAPLPSSPNATSDTVNAAILTGNVPSTGSGATQFSGGVNNLPRLLEAWSSSSGTSYQTLTLNTSLANLFASTRATNVFQNPGFYYYAPTRQFSFNQNFLSPTQLPPGTPLLLLNNPVITVPPQSQTVSAGQTAVFNVSATGNQPLAYEWLFNSTPISNATNSTLTITNASAGNAGFYSVIVTNAFGSQTSSNAALTVICPPLIYAQPVSQAAPPGTEVTFTVSAGGTAPLGYQWTFNGSVIADATNPSLMISGVQSSNTGSYRATVTNALGSVTSLPANLFLANPPDFLWARSVSNGNASGFSGADGIAADASGNLIVAGSFGAPTLDFGGGVLTNDNWAVYGVANFICEYDRAGNLLWAGLAGTNSAYAWPVRIGTDASGNAYLAGRFAGIGTFGTNVLVSSSPADMFVAKYNPQGQVLWARRIGAYDNTLSSYYFGFAVDPGGNAFVASGDGGSADFGTVTLTNSTAFLVKYDNAGNLVWAREALGANAMALGTNGAVCLTGKPGILAKYDNQGSLVWSNSFPIGQAIVLDAQENIFTTGYGAGTYDGLTLTNSGGSPDFFAAKCDPSGHLQWLRQVGSVQQQVGTAIGLDEYGNVYVTSISAIAQPEPVLSFGTTVLTNVFTFAAKYDPVGNPLWARAPATTNLIRAGALAVKDSADVFVGGYFTGTASIGTLTLSNSYGCTGGCAAQMFVAKLDGAEATALPTITAGPQDQVVMAGSDVTFSVTVPSGIPLSYQWFYDQTNAIAGATGSSLFLSNVQLPAAGNYSVAVSNAYGSIISEAASLTVNPIVLVVSAPASVTNCPGTSASFNVNATGTGLSYQWYLGGNALAGQTGSSLVLSSVGAADAGTYSVVVSDAFGDAVTNSANLTVNQNVVVVSAPVSVTNCPGSSANFNVNATGTGLSYQWYLGGNALAGQTGSGLALSSLSASDAGTYGVVVSDVCGNAMTNSASLTVNQNLVVVSAPLSLTNCPGTGASFSVNATGTGLSYQWYKGGSPLAGLTGSSLSLNNVSASDAGSYSVTVSGVCGSPVSQSATLTVNQNVAVASGPVSETNCPGSSASFSVSATGTGLSYQWYNGTNGLAGQTNSSLVLSNVAAGDAGAYGVVVSDVCGNAVTNSASLTVNQNLVVVSAPVSLTNCPGTSASFSVNATGTGLSYQWYKGGTRLPGLTRSSMQISSVSAADAGTRSVVVSDVCGNAVTNSASLTVNQNLVVVSAPVSLTNCPGTSASFNVNATGTGLSYQWYKGGSPLAGQTGSSLSLNNVSASDAASYSVTVSGICGSPVSQSATLTVNQNVAVASGPVSVTNCPGSSASFSVSATGTGLSYQWYNGTNGLAGQTNSSLVLSNVAAGDAGTYGVVVSDVCGNAVTNSASLTVNQNLVVVSAPVSLTNCPGTSASFNLNATGTGLSYQWYLGGNALAGQTGSGLALSSVSASDAGTYGVVVSDVCGNAVTNSASLTVNQNVVVVSAPVSLTNCPGTSASFSVSATGTSLSYQWYKGGSPLAGQTGSSLSLNNVSASDAGSYSVTVSGVCGSPVSQSATLTVNQSVAVASGPVSVTNCPGSSASFSVSAMGTGLSYQWYNGTNGLAGQTNSSLVLSSVAAGDAGTYGVVVSDVCGNAVTNSASLTVNQNLVVVSAPVSLTNCPGTSASFSVNATGAGLSYQWYQGGSALAGQTGSSLVLSSVSVADSGSYSVVVSDVCGNAVTNSASLTVCVAPSISAAPQSLTLLAGRDAVFNVGATGTEPLVYQWQFNGTNLVDATNATLILRSVTTAQAGAYGVMVTNQAGIAGTSATCCVYSTAAAVLTALPSFSGNGCQFTITGVPGFNYAVEASTNLVDWVPLSTNTSPFTFVDGDAVKFPARCYRSVYLP